MNIQSSSFGSAQQEWKAALLILDAKKDNYIYSLPLSVT